jgi:hypothetical protein
LEVLNIEFEVLSKEGREERSFDQTHGKRMRHPGWVRIRELRELGRATDLKIGHYIEVELNDESCGAEG